MVPREHGRWGDRVGALLLCGVGEGLEADLVAEGFELADHARLGFGGDTSSEVVGAGITVEVAVGEHVPGRHEYGMLHGNNSSIRRAPVMRSSREP
jgi:hypothetical protein